MPEETTNPERANMSSLMEQHLGTILQILVVGLLAWSLSTTLGLSKDVEVLKVQMTMLTQSAADRYTSQDAARDRELVNALVDRLERRVTRLEEKGVK